MSRSLASNSLVYTHPTADNNPNPNPNPAAPAIPGGSGRSRSKGYAPDDTTRLFSIGGDGDATPDSMLVGVFERLRSGVCQEGQGWENQGSGITVQFRCEHAKRQSNL